MRRIFFGGLAALATTFSTTSGALAQAGNLYVVIGPTCGAQQLYTSADKGQARPPAIDYFGNLCNSTGGSGTGGPTQTTSGALQPATAASGKITKNSTTLTANTSTTIAPANANRIALSIQCAAGAVNIDETGGTLSSATTGGTVVIPTGNFPLYIPPIATLTAITAYSTSAQVCTVTEYLR